MFGTFTFIVKERARSQRLKRGRHFFNGRCNFQIYCCTKECVGYNCENKETCVVIARQFLKKVLD